MAGRTTDSGDSPRGAQHAGGLLRPGEDPGLKRSLRVLAIASGGGHWAQLMRISPALASADTTFASVHTGYSRDVAGKPFVVVGDANLNTKSNLIRVALRVIALLIRLRPDIVISTGAAPGFLAIMFGRLFGARTVWLDSIANAETMSLSGLRVRRYADLWLTQWEHLAGPDGPAFLGSTL